ncbi:MAG: S1C family serine protease [Spirochaetota bacterium]
MNGARRTHPPRASGAALLFLPPVLLVLALPLLLAGCASVTEVSGETPERADVVREQVQEMIDSGRPERAIERVGMLRSEEILGDAELDAFHEAAVSEMRDRYDRARRNGEYAEAQRRLHSLYALGGDVRPPGLDQLYLSWALAREADEDNVVALQLLMQMEDLTLLETSLLTRFGEHARSLHNREALRRISEELRRRGADVPETLVLRENASTGAREALPGTVTVWVNRGIRMEQGAGVPDRIIGSGFFIDPRGYLITNYHVIRSEVDPKYEGYSRLFIRLPGRPENRIPATVVGYDPVFDIALLKAEITPPRVFSFTDIRRLDPGTEVRAIGSPGGLDNSITSGIISATGRRFLQLGDALQIDVPINPGSSGGPLLTRSGDLVGVVFAGVPQFQGVNFAIPSFWLSQLVPRLYEGGEVTHSWIGVSLRKAADGLAVNYVAPASPATRVGLQRGDVITTIGDTRVSSLAEAQDELMDYRPGTLVRLGFRRDDTIRARNVVVAERPFSPIEHALEYQDAAEVFAPLFGMEINAVGTLPWQRNFVVTEVYAGSVADETGLSARDPFSLHRWEVDYERRIALAQIIIRKRKAGFLESGVQLASYLEQDNFL